jgi:preprotein translocase subunit SecY
VLLVDIVVVVAGSMLLMWLGELITEFGIGNGVSLIIFAGIVSQIPASASQLIFTFDPAMLPIYIVGLAVSLLVIFGVVVITEAERPIPITYARQTRGQGMGGMSTYLPLRVNQAGVIPIIFALSIMLFPGVIANFLVGVNNETISRLAQRVVDVFQDQLFYGVLYFVLVVAFTYFYTSVTFDPGQIAENVQKQGGFIPGIRPGKQTMKYLKYVVNRITFTGALFLGFIAVLPLLLQAATGVTTLTIGGTALLIVVSVVLETMKQLESQLTMRQYEGL